MKKNITKLAIAYISLAFAQSISAETLTLKTGADNVITEWWNWSDTSKWSPTVSEVAGNDLTLNINNGSVALFSTINPGFHAGNVSISVVNPKEHVFFDVEGDAEFESLSLSQSSKGYYNIPSRPYGAYFNYKWRRKHSGKFCLFIKRNFFW